MHVYHIVEHCVLLTVIVVKQVQVLIAEKYVSVADHAYKMSDMIKKIAYSSSGSGCEEACLSNCNDIIHSPNILFTLKPTFLEKNPNKTCTHFVFFAEFLTTIIGLFCVETYRSAFNCSYVDAVVSLYNDLLTNHIFCLETHSAKPPHQFCYESYQYFFRLCINFMHDRFSLKTKNTADIEVSKLYEQMSSFWCKCPNGCTS